MLNNSIKQHLDQIAARLRERFPDGQRYHFFRDKYFGGIRVYFCLRFGFDQDRKRESVEWTNGLAPAEMVVLRSDLEDEG